MLLDFKYFFLLRWFHVCWKQFLIIFLFFFSEFLSLPVYFSRSFIIQNKSLLSLISNRERWFLKIHFKSFVFELREGPIFLFELCIPSLGWCNTIFLLLLLLLPSFVSINLVIPKQYLTQIVITLRWELLILIIKSAV